MPSLKEFRSRIASVKSTQRITSAMKMVAAAKLRRAQEQAIAARPYAERMARMLGSLAAAAGGEGAPPLMAGTGSDETHLLVIMTTDRGLCGAFNSTLIRDLRRRVQELEAGGKRIKLFPVGRKGVTAVRREFEELMLDSAEEVAKPSPDFAKASDVSGRIAELFEAGEFDVCTVVYNHFVSALTQEVTPQQLIPFRLGEEQAAEAAESGGGASYEFEPDEEEILADLLPRNLSLQIYRAMLESFASEQGARMTAMDNATRNAGELIDNLTITYNRTRQAFITRELIEIISGAEALQ